MKSLKELYRVGKGPSSSHTMGPQRAAKLFQERCPNASYYEVTLYGSLAATGKGHMTDVAIEEVLRPHKTVNIIWQPQTFLPYHPNGMKFVGKDLNGDIIDEWTVYSIGGGAISDGTAGNEELGAKDVYDLNKLADIKQWCYDNGRSFWEYVEKCESEDIWDYLDMVWQTMKQSIRNGLNHEGVLPGPLKLQRKAATYYIKAKGYRASLQSRGLVYAYALAVSEENASGGTIVTAPTCGACGVLPAVLYHMFTSHDMSEQRILRALGFVLAFKAYQEESNHQSGIQVVQPLDYLSFAYLTAHAKGVITDSGNVAEEATFNGVPCITLNSYTEHIETVKVGTNELVAEDPELLKQTMQKLLKGEWKKAGIPDRWDGRSAERIVQILAE